MVKYYYVGPDNKAYGPIAPTESLKYGLTPQTNVCAEGGNSWTPLQSIPGLINYLTPAACPPPAQPTPYAAPQPNGYMQTPPPNNMVWAILTTIFCCLPFGVVAIVKASNVNSLWRAGQYEEALRNSKEAGKWALWSLLASIIGVVLYFLFVGSLFVGLL